MFNFSISNNLNNIEKQQLFKSQEDLKKELNVLKEDLNSVNENNKKLLDLQDKSLKAFESCSILVKENKDNLEQSVNMLTDLIKEDRKSINDNSRKIKDFQQQFEDLKQNYLISVQNMNQYIRYNNEINEKISNNVSDLFKRFNSQYDIINIYTKLISIQQQVFNPPILKVKCLFIDSTILNVVVNQRNGYHKEYDCIYIPITYYKTIKSCLNFLHIQKQINDYLYFINNIRNKINEKQHSYLKKFEFVDIIFDFIKTKSLICNELIKKIDKFQIYDLYEFLNLDFPQTGDPFSYEPLTDFNKVMNLKDFDEKYSYFSNEIWDSKKESCPKEFNKIYFFSKRYLNDLQYIYNLCCKLNERVKPLILNGNVKIIKN